MEKSKIIIGSIVILVIIMLIIGGYFLINKSTKPVKKIRTPQLLNISEENWCKKGAIVSGYNGSYFNHPIGFTVVNKTRVNGKDYCEIRTMDQKPYYLSLDKKELLNKTTLDVLSSS